VLKDPYPDTIDVGAHRRVEEVRRRQSWGVAALVVGISATAIMVPPLVTSWSGNSVPLGHTVPPTSESATPTPTTVTSPTVTSANVTPPVSAPSNPAQPAFLPIRIPAGAASNELFGRAAVIACPTCVSGSRVQYLGQGAFVVVNVRGVTVAGPRTLTITYESDGTRNLYVSVNGADPTELVLAGHDDWTTPATATTPITLPTGNTTIKFFNQTDPAPDLDEILIS
jgi:hypothetical protein